MGLVFNAEAEHIFLTAADLYIHKNLWPAFSVRCRVFNLEDGIPGEDLLTESVVVTDSLKRGKMHVDLRPYALYVDKPIFVAFEWVFPKFLAEQYAERETNRPQWWTEGTVIANGKEIWYYDKHGHIARKEKLTDRQKVELEQYHMNTTEFAVKSSSYRGFARESSVSPWVETDNDVKIRLHYRTIKSTH